MLWLGKLWFKGVKMGIYRYIYSVSTKWKKSTSNFHWNVNKLLSDQNSKMSITYYTKASCLCSSHTDWTLTCRNVSLAVVTPNLSECVDDHITRENDVQLSEPYILGFVAGHCLLEKQEMRSFYVFWKPDYSLINKSPWPLYLVLTTDCVIVTGLQYYLTCWDMRQARNKDQSSCEKTPDEIKNEDVFSHQCHTVQSVHRDGVWQRALVNQTF